MRALLQNLANQHDGRDDRRRLEIERHAVRGAQRLRETVAPEHGRHAVEKRRAGARDDQRKHVGVALAERFPPTAQERPAAPEKHRRRQRTLEPRRNVGRETMRERRHHAAHRQQKHRHTQRQRHPQPRPQIAFRRQPHVNRGIRCRVGRRSVHARLYTGTAKSPQASRISTMKFCDWPGGTQCSPVLCSQALAGPIHGSTQ